MEKIDEGQLEKLLEDISTIKSVINRNKSLLKSIMAPSHFRFISWVWGIGVIIFSLTLHFIIAYYGEFDLIPSTLRGGIYIAVVLGLAFVMFFKQRILIQRMRREYPNLKMAQVYKELYSYHIRHIYFPLVFFMVFLVFFLIYQGQTHYIVPAISIGAGFIFNYIGSLTEVKQYFISGYWYLGLGIVLLIFSSVPPFIGLAATLGVGSILFAVTLKKEG